MLPHRGPTQAEGSCDPRQECADWEGSVTYAVATLTVEAQRLYVVEHTYSPQRLHRRSCRDHGTVNLSLRSIQKEPRRGRKRALAQHCCLAFSDTASRSSSSSQQSARSAILQPPAAAARRDRTWMWCFCAQLSRRKPRASNDMWQGMASFQHQAVDAQSVMSGCTRGNRRKEKETNARGLIRHALRPSSASGCHASRAPFVPDALDGRSRTHAHAPRK
jgi:hypothetical protein